jgi:hypothetical protein
VIRNALASAVRDALAALAVEPLPERVELERPARKEHGDWSSNVAMANAKKAWAAIPVSWRNSSSTGSTPTCRRTSSGPRSPAPGS